MANDDQSDFWLAYRDPQWQRKKYEVFKYHDWTCEECGEETRQLHAHHTHYVRGRKPWEYSISEYKCLCDKCHEEVTHLLRDAKKELGQLQTYQLHQAMGYIRGLLMLDCPPATFAVVNYEVGLGIAHAWGFHVDEVLRLVVSPDFTVDGFVLEELRKSKREGKQG